MALLLSACGGEADSTQARGPDPKLPDPQRGLLPSMKIAEPTAWGDQKPAVPEGFSITAIASDLNIPRQSIVLPNGDIIVAEGRGGSAAKLKPKDVIASVIKAQGNTKVKSGNRLTLLRDADGDGKYELKTVFAENLNAPYGLAFANGKLYVANQDALVSFDYQEGQTKASGEPTKVTDLPSAINH
ncbi:sorbosone dehydrogenase, partial [Pseudomonas syringae pv. syringae FF5]